MVMTFRRGNSAVGLAGMFIALASGAYFPLTLLPEWLQSVDAGDADGDRPGADPRRAHRWHGMERIGAAAAVLIAWAVCSLAIGLVAFRRAVKRERRLGTLGLY